MGTIISIFRKKKISEEEMFRTIADINASSFGAKLVLRLENDQLFVEHLPTQTNIIYMHHPFHARWEGKMPYGPKWVTWVYQNFINSAAEGLGCKIKADTMDGSWPPEKIHTFVDYAVSDWGDVLRTFPGRKSYARKHLENDLALLPEELKPFAGPLEIPNILLEDLEIIAKEGDRK